MKFNALFLLLISGLFFNACKKDDPDPVTPVTPSIIVGVGTSELKIGDPAQKAIDLYGQTSDSYGVSGGQYQHFMTYFTRGVIVYLESTYSATFDPQTKIKYLTLSAPFEGKTDKNIGIGSTKTEVLAAYGQPASSSPFFGDTYANGLTIAYDDNGVLVEVIDVRS